MQAHILGARATALGKYDFKGPNGEEYRFLDLYDDEQGEIVRISLSQECQVPEVEFGTLVDLWVEVRSATKIVRGAEAGSDRSIAQTKLRAVDVRLSAAANGRAKKADPVEAVA